MELRGKIVAGEVGTPVLAHCVHRNVDVPPGWTSETTVVSAASHEIDVMPWVFGRDIIRVTWLFQGKLPFPRCVTLKWLSWSLRAALSSLTNSL